MAENLDRLDDAAARLGISVQKDEPMSRHTTFRIGGPADRFLSVGSAAQLRELLAVLESEQIPAWIVGNGSNLLVSDQGLRGAVLSLDGDFKKIDLLPDGVTLRAGAGASLAALCAFARDRGLTGLEFAWGIPGTVGGAVFMNAGAYGGEMKDVVVAVTHLTKAGETVTLPEAAMEFGYRHSRYTESGDLILWAEFRMAPGDPAQIAARMEELMARRKEKQPYDQPSAGSVFKRPVGGYAAALIDQCGLKGAQVGGAQVSPKHAGFIVNTGGATCADVLALIAQIQEKVLAETGIQLETEVRPIGS